MATLVTPAEKVEKVEKNVPPTPEEKSDRMQRGQAQVIRFADGEAYVQIQENVRGCDVFVMQPTCRAAHKDGGKSTSVDEHLMELLLMIDALKRASARRITAVMPYFGYARQDRKDKPRSPISSKLVA